MQNIMKLYSNDNELQKSTRKSTELARNWIIKYGNRNKGRGIPKEVTSQSKAGTEDPTSQKVP
jgi:hypothetical protein